MFQVSNHLAKIVSVTNVSEKHGKDHVPTLFDGEPQDDEQRSLRRQRSGPRRTNRVTPNRRTVSPAAILRAQSRPSFYSMEK